MTARAKRRLADEYDAAQERGEIRTQRDNQAFSGMEKASGADLVDPKLLHDARIIRDAEIADPGIVRRALDEKLAQGEEPPRLLYSGFGRFLIFPSAQTNLSL